MTQSAIMGTADRPIFSVVPRIFQVIGNSLEMLFGFVSLVFFLALVSAIPVLNLLSLGYLLESSARVARSGRFQDGLRGLSGFARAGTITLGIWLWILPIRMTLSVLRDAELVDPASWAVTNLGMILAVLVVVTGVHLFWALVRGGKARHFLWPAPVRFVRWLGEARDWHGTVRNVSKFVSDLRLFSVWKIGALGFLGAALWLAIPVGLLVLAADIPKQGLSALCSFLGGVGLAVAVGCVPFLQTKCAMTGRFGVFLDRRSAGALFRRAPLATWVALVATLFFAIPLFLLRIEPLPREVAWLSSVVVVLFILPARLLAGWAVARAGRADRDCLWISQWTARLLAVPVVAGYAFVVWLSQFVSWHGALGLLEQPAFIVPAPLLGL